LPVGSGEANNPTATRLRAKQRGQCSTVNQAALGVIVNPHRGQFKWKDPALLEAGSREERCDTNALISRVAVGAYLAASA